MCGAASTGSDYVESGGSAALVAAVPQAFLCVRPACQLHYRPFHAVDLDQLQAALPGVTPVRSPRTMRRQGGSGD